MALLNYKELNELKEITTLKIRLHNERGAERSGNLTLSDFTHTDVKVTLSEEKIGSTWHLVYTSSAPTQTPTPGNGFGTVPRTSISEIKENEAGMVVFVILSAILWGGYILLGKRKVNIL